MNENHEILRACLYGEDIWIVTSTDAYLYKLARESNVLQEVALISREKDEKTRIYNICAADDSLFFIMWDQAYLARYYIETGKFEYYTLPGIGKPKKGVNFSSGYLYGKFFYLLGYSFPGILRVNLQSGECTVIDGFIKECVGKLTDETKGYFPLDFVEKSNSLYIPFHNRNAILKFNLISEEATVIEIGPKNQSYLAIQTLGDDFLLIPANTETGAVVRWNCTTEKTELYNNYPESFVPQNNTFYTEVLYRHKLIMFANVANENVCLNLETGKMESFPDFYDTSEMRKMRYKFTKLVGDKILYIQTGIWGYWNLQTGENEQHIYSLEEKTIKRLKQWKYRPLLERNAIIRERRVKLKDYIDAICWCDV